MQVKRVLLGTLLLGLACGDPDGNGDPIAIELSEEPTVMAEGIQGMNATSDGHAVFWGLVDAFNYMPDQLFEIPFDNVRDIKVSEEGYLLITKGSSLVFVNRFGGILPVDQEVIASDLAGSWVAYATASDVVLKHYDGIVVDEIFRVTLQAVEQIKLSLSETDAFIYVLGSNGTVNGMRIERTQP